MSNTRKFSDFDSPDSGIEVGGAKEAGVLLTDTLEDLREKTNGIVEEVNNIDVAYKAADAVITSEYQAADTVITGDYQAADTVITSEYQAADNVITSEYQAADDAIKTDGLNVNALHIEQIEKIQPYKLLGNVSGTTANVVEIEIDLHDGGAPQNSDDVIPTSANVVAHVGTETVLRVHADADIREGHVTRGLNDNSVKLEKIEKIHPKMLLGNAGVSLANVHEVWIDDAINGLQNSDNQIPTSKAVRARIADEVATTLASAKTYTNDAIEANDVGRVHFIDVYGHGGGYGERGNVNAYAGPQAGATGSENNIPYVANLMKGVVKKGHFILARFKQLGRYGTNNGTEHHWKQLLVMFKVTGIGTGGIPTLTHHNDGYSGY